MFSVCVFCQTLNGLIMLTQIPHGGERGPWAAVFAARVLALSRRCRPHTCKTSTSIMTRRKGRRQWTGKTHLRIDLEQFLSQLNWAPPHGSTDDYSSNPEPLQLEQSEGYHQEVEMRALKEHLKAIVKDIHIAIGESHMCNTQYLLYIMHPSTFPCLLLIFIYTFLTRILAQNHKILCQYTIQGLGESSCLSCQMPYVQTKPSHSCTSTCLCPTNCFL